MFANHEFMIFKEIELTVLIKRPCAYLIFEFLNGREGSFREKLHKKILKMVFRWA